MEFEWDPGKSASNLRKHGVSFVEAASAFADPLAEQFYDPEHSQDEDRYLLLGMSSERSVLVISHTEREQRIRIISARRATRRERKHYENG